MKSHISKVALNLVLLIALLGLCACNSTRSENGVLIKQKTNYNPLSYIPGL